MLKLEASQAAATTLSQELQALAEEKEAAGPAQAVEQQNLEARLAEALSEVEMLKAELATCPPPDKVLTLPQITLSLSLSVSLSLSLSSCLSLWSGRLCFPGVRKPLWGMWARQMPELKGKRDTGCFPHCCRYQLGSCQCALTRMYPDVVHQIMPPLIIFGLLMWGLYGDQQPLLVCC